MQTLPRCTCGYTKFGERVDRTRFLAERWRTVGARDSVGLAEGLGSLPFGTGFAAGGQQAWGRFVVPVVTGIRNTICLSCARVRRGVPVGGGIAMGSWLEGQVVCALMTDVVDPACISARFSLESGASYDAEVEVRPFDPQGVPSLSGQPLEQQESLPVAAVLPSRVYRVSLPEGVSEGGVYRLTFHDRCLDSVQSIIELELGAGIVSLYGRQGDVVAAPDDYAASQLVAGVESMPGVMQNAFLDSVQARLDACAELGRDLAGSVEVPTVIGIRGLAIEDAAPADGAELTWSSANQRWEVR